MAELRVVTIAFTDKQNGSPYSGGIIDLFLRLETLMVQDSTCLYRRVNDKLMRLHAYEWPDLNEKFVVVPFGTLKELDKPMGLNEDTQKLEDIDKDMFDVNCLAFYEPFNVALLTVNKPGPSLRNIEEYLNQFFPDDFPYKICINSILKDTRLERMRASREARELVVTLDLGRPLNQMFREQVAEEQGVAAALRLLATASKEVLESKTFTLTLGLGRAKKATMDVEAMIELLDELNLEDCSIKEISVKFRDNQTQKLDTVFAKSTRVSLSIPFQYEGRVSSEVLKHNLEEILTPHRGRFFGQVRDRFAGAELVRCEYDLIRRGLAEEERELVGAQR